MAWQKPLVAGIALSTFALFLPSERSVKKQAYKQYYGSDYKKMLHPPKTTEVEAVKNLLHRFRDAKQMADPGNSMPGAVLIRPSGNPLKLDEELGKWLHENISDHSCEFLDQPALKIEISRDGDMAYSVHRERAKFLYRGKPNDDHAVWTTIYRKQSDGQWKVAHAQRSSGQ
eukprot:g5815.t1